MFSGVFSAGDHRAVTDSGQAAVRLKMNSQSMAVSKELRVPGRGKVQKKSLVGRIEPAENLLLHESLSDFECGWRGFAVFHRDGPCVSQTAAWRPLQRRTLVALMWPVQLLLPRGAQADFSEVLSFDWLGLRLCLWIVRPQNAEMVFREELQAKEINSVLHIGFLKDSCFLKKGRINIWLELLDSQRVHTCNGRRRGKKINIRSSSVANRNHKIMESNNGLGGKEH